MNRISHRTCGPPNHPAIPPSQDIFGLRGWIHFAREGLKGQVMADSSYRLCRKLHLANSSLLRSTGPSTLVVAYSKYRPSLCENYSAVVVFGAALNKWAIYSLI